MTAPLLPHVAGGAHLAPATARSAPVYDPATGAVTARVPLADATDVRRVLDDAAAAAPAWAERSASDRAQVLFRFRERCLADQDTLAHLISAEHGKVLADARGELLRGLEVIEFACGIPHLMKGEFSDQVSRGIDMHSLRQPLGVVACITPFNFPAMVPMWMLGPALATGNCVVLKPSERDPSCPVRLAELWTEAGGPPGTFNVLHGDKAAVDALLTDPVVQAVSFVGSTPVAQYVHETAARHGKRVQAMGGAKNHCVVLPDADLAMVTDALMGAAYGSAGERCMAISVAVAVGDAMADALVAALADRVRALTIGAPTVGDPMMGPVVTADHKARIAGHIADGAAAGATLVVDGRAHPMAQGAGFFLGGTLFDHVTPAMSIYQEEIFGPVLCVVRVGSAEEALALCDAHRYGNGVAVFTRSGGAARDFAHRVRCGMVGINVAIPVPLAFYSFGGWKASAFADHNQHGMDGVRFFTRVKTVTTRWPEGTAGASFTMPVLR
ncbi:MAG: CoA-acylating methylmalonate-semialdehyde dehydrogenase [Gemmatimonadaceae bacterium]|nr:CoA-acylating methylmalonate-semialdehyde dehydrogenase [Gemmatimonadaceae bacterium]